MRKTNVAVRVLFGGAVMLFATGSAFAQAPQQPPPSEQQPPAQQERQRDPQQNRQATTLQGELVRVDAEAKLLVVKGADNKEVEFAYTDSTQISGAQDSAAGLATMKEGRVTVHFTEDASSKKKTATRIIVEPKK
jgi:glucose/arabinose dehydrogenase